MALPGDFLSACFSSSVSEVLKSPTFLFALTVPGTGESVLERGGEMGTTLLNDSLFAVRGC